MPIEFIDAHVHAHNRYGEDFQRLGVAGCAALVAVADEEGAVVHDNAATFLVQGT